MIFENMFWDAQGRNTTGRECARSERNCFRNALAGCWNVPERDKCNIIGRIPTLLHFTSVSLKGIDLPPAFAG